MRAGMSFPMGLFRGGHMRGNFRGFVVLAQTGVSVGIEGEADDDQRKVKTKCGIWRHKLA